MQPDAFLLTLVLAPLLAPRTPDAALSATDVWTVDIAYQAADKLGACTIADVDPNYEGPELVTVCRTGHVFVVVRDGDAWTPRIVGKTPGEMIQVVAGDLLPDRPGLEIAAVGAASGAEADERPGKAWVFHREGSGWRSTAAYTSPRLLHAVTILDGELVVGGYDEELVALRPDGERWTSRVIGALPGAAKCALTVGERAFVACTDGSVVVSDGAAIDVVQHRDAPRARLGSDGERLAVCDDDGTLSLVAFDGTAETIHREGDKLRGAVLGDLDASRPGSEAASVGYARRLTIHVRDASGWTALPILHETERFHGLASGDLDGDGEHELVACGYSGRLIVIDRHAP